MKTVTTHEAKTHLSKLIQEAEAGTDIVIRRGDTPVARLIPYTADKQKAPTKRRRPKVGEITSKEISWTEGAFDPMSDEELKDWGL